MRDVLSTLRTLLTMWAVSVVAFGLPLTLICVVGLQFWSRVTGNGA